MQSVRSETGRDQTLPNHRAPLIKRTGTTSASLGCLLYQVLSGLPLQGRWSRDCVIPEHAASFRYSWIMADTGRDEVFNL